MDGLWVILLEAFVALCFLLGIVWATWPKGKPDADPADAANKENTP
jgi:cbb3-type cytochrome oxidase subunit 3